MELEGAFSCLAYLPGFVEIYFVMHCVHHSASMPNSHTLEGAWLGATNDTNNIKGRKAFKFPLDLG